MPAVFNKRIHGTPEGAIYVGRDQVISRYQTWLVNKVVRGELDITELEGRDLVCWCAPKACHADDLLALAAHSAGIGAPKGTQT